VRGIRIELGEIESILKEHPLLREAVVTVSGTNPGSEHLVAYVIGSGDTVPGTTELRQYLNSRVPDFMIPSIFVTLQAIPLLPNGKVNRGALPSVNPEQIAAQHAFIPPRNEKEEKLASLWRDLLGIEHIGIDHNFFELGGHSLLGMQLLARIRRTFEVELPVRRLFEEPTIAGLALEIERAAANGIGPKARSIPRRPRTTGSDTLPTELDNLSPDQMAALLERLLREKRNEDR
jgi:acyl carrier protein